MAVNWSEFTPVDAVDWGAFEVIDDSRDQAEATRLATRSGMREDERASVPSFRAAGSGRDVVPQNAGLEPPHRRPLMSDGLTDEQRRGQRVQEVGFRRASSERLGLDAEAAEIRRTMPSGTVERTSAVDSAAARLRQAANVAGMPGAAANAETLARSLLDTGASAARTIPQTAALMSDVAQLLTAGRVGADAGRFLRQIDADMQADQSAVYRGRATQLAQFIEAGDASGAAQLLIANPGFAVDLALPALGTMVPAVGGGALAARLSTLPRAVRALPAAELQAIRGGAATAGANAANIGMNAGQTYAETGDYGAAATAGVFTALGGRLTRGGAEGAVARGARPSVAGVMAREGVQEATESLGQSIGEQTASNRFEPGKAFAQATVEGGIGALAGGVAGVSLPAQVEAAISTERTLRQREDDALRQAETPEQVLNAAAATMGRRNVAADAILSATELMRRARSMDRSVDLMRLTERDDAWLQQRAQSSTSEAVRMAAQAEILRRQSPQPAPVIPAATDADLLARVPVAQPIEPASAGAAPATEERPTFPVARLDDGRIVKQNGRPWSDRGRALQAARALGEDVEVVPFDQGDLRGYALRPREDFSAGEGASREATRAPGAPTVDAAADQAAASPRNDLTPPTAAQALAGNYTKGHARIGGLDFSIENPQGSVREDKKNDPPRWRVTMSAHYGDIKGTTDNTGENVDAYIKPGTPLDYSGSVYVVDQINERTGQFDEPKAMIGYASQREAERAYDAHHDDGRGPDRRGAVTAMPWEQFRQWVTSDGPTSPLSYRPSTQSGASPTVAPQPVASPAPQAQSEPPSSDLILAQRGEPFLSRALAQLAADRIGRGHKPVRVDIDGRRGWAVRPPPPREVSARIRRPGATVKNSVLRLIAREGGISTRYFREITGERYTPQMAMRLGLLEVFRRDGRGIDQIADEVLQGRFLSQAQIDSEDDPGGVRAAIDLIADAIQRRKDPQYRTPSALGDEEAEFGRLRDRALSMRDAGQADTEADSLPAEIDAEALAEREAIMAEADALADSLTDDDVRAFLDPGDPMSADNLRKLGFTDEEAAQLADDADAGPAPSRSPQAGLDAGRAEGEGDRRTGPPQEAGEPAGRAEEDSLLSNPTPDELRRREIERERAQQEQARAENAPPPEDFTLTGSNRAVDQAEARGQSSLFDQPNPATAVADALREAAEKIEKALNPASKQQASAAPEALPSADRITDVGEKIGGARKDTSTSTGARGSTPKDETPGWRKRYTISQVLKSSQAGEEGRWVINDTKARDFYGQPRQIGNSFATQEEAEAAVPLAEVARNHRVMYTKGEDGAEKFAIMRTVSDRKRVQVVQQLFDTEQAAKEYMVRNAEQIIETKTSFGEEILPRPDNVRREGPQRRQGNVRGEDFKDTFGFRAVEFGNWEAQDERQTVMNHAYDALMDLADVLGVPPKALGLNGELALAFGARGQGLSGARAHYDLDYGVINLTKMSGAGSLAHEWMHAADHYFGRQDGKASSKKVKNKRGDMVWDALGRDDDFVSHGTSRTSGMRAELKAAYDQVMDAIRFKAEQYVEDTQKADRFVAEVRTDVANRLQQIRQNLAGEVSWGSKRAPATAEQLAKFDELAEKIVSGEYLELELRRRPGSKAKFGGYQWSNDGMEALSALFKAVRGRSGMTAQGGVLNDLAADMKRYGARLKMLADAQAQTTKTRNLPTSFTTEAKRIDQGRASDYWSTPHELAARAFESYVEDRIADRGGRSDFLTYGTNTVVPTPWGWARPFPQGEERQAINAAFDSFVQALQTRETDQGVELFDRTRGSDDSIPVPRNILPYWIRTAPQLATAFRRWEAGKITDEALAGAVRAELDKRKDRRERAGDLVRGADWIRERLIRARRIGELSEREVDLALWLIDQNPAVATDLGISIREGDENSPNGTYNLLTRVVTIFSSRSNEDTATHEILHHTERMMPEDVREGIRKEWLKQLRLAVKNAKASEQQRTVMDWMLEAAEQGNDGLALRLWSLRGQDGVSVQDVLPYKLAAASEFWAVNGAALMRQKAEAGTWVKKVKQWLRELTAKVRALMGLPSDAAVLMGLRAVIAGDGTFVSKSMISAVGSEVVRDVASANGDALNPLNRWELPSESSFAAVRRILQDAMLRVRAVQEAITVQGGTVGVAQDVYRAEERMHGRIQHQIKQLKDERMRPLMDKLARLDLTPQDLALYAYAKHAPERNAYVARLNPDLRGNGSGMSNAEASHVLDRFLRDGKAEALEDVHADLLAITRATRRKLLDAGLIAADHYERLERMFSNYVPLRGFEKIELNAAGQPVIRPTGGIDVRGNDVRHLEGRTSRAATILENVILDHERAIVRAERNAVAKVFLDLVTTNPDPALWEVQPLRRERAEDPQLRLFDLGAAVRLDDVDKGDDTIGLKVGGESVYVRIKDPLLLRAMKRAYLDETGDLQRLIAESVGWYSNWLRNTLTRWNPAFVVVNSIRDAQTGAISTLDALGWGATATYARHYPAALAAAWRNERGTRNPEQREWDRWFEEFKAAGGVTGGFFMRDASDVFDELRAEILDAGGTLDARGSGVARVADAVYLKVRGAPAAKLAAATLRAVEMMGGASENAARVAAYRTAREMGKTAAEAASIAKNLTVNFNRRGEWGTAMNSLYLFFNAAVQGSHRTLVALKNPRVQVAMAGLVGLAMALALGNAEWGGDDENGEANWDKVPDFVKERNLVIMIPPGWDVPGVSDKAGQAKYLKVPLPYGFNVFAVLGNSLADTLRNFRDPRRGITPTKAAINLTSAVAGSFNPMGGSFDPTDPVQMAMAAAPTIADLPIQLATERNSWGRPAVPSRSAWDARPDSERMFLSDAGTAQQRIAQWLNSTTGGDRARPGAIDIAPGTIETLARGATGGLGTFLADVASTVSQLGDSGAAVNPANVPIFKALYGQHDNRVDQGRFYENRKAIEERYRQNLTAMKAGLPVDLSDPEDRAVMELGETLGMVSRFLSQLRRAEIAVIEADKPADWKRLERERIDAQRTALMRSFNKSFNETFKPAKRRDKEQQP